MQFQVEITSPFADLNCCVQVITVYEFWHVVVSCNPTPSVSWLSNVCGSCGSPILYSCQMTGGKMLEDGEEFLKTILYGENMVRAVCRQSLWEVIMLQIVI